MVGGEALVVRPVARLMNVEDGDGQAGLFVIAADAAGGLDILGAGLRLAENHHEPEADDVEADRDHVGRDGHVDAVFLAVSEGKPSLGLGNLGGAYTRLVSSTGS